MKNIEDRRVEWEAFQLLAVYILDNIDTVAEGEEPEEATNPA